MMKRSSFLTIISFLITFAGCMTPAGKDVFRDPNMDFAAVKTVAVMPFSNLTGDREAGERVRDVFMVMLFATGEMYVVPSGEVARGIERAGIANPTAPSSEEILKFARIVKTDAVITGAVREYGTVRSGNTSANVISLSLQMVETQTGKIVWTASSTKGGIGIGDRLLGGGGEAMNKVTEKAVDDILDKLFR